MSASKALSRLTRASEKLSAAQLELDAAIREARDAGLSYRAMSEATDRSHEFFRKRLLRR